LGPSYAVPRRNATGQRQVKNANILGLAEGRLYLEFEVNPHVIHELDLGTKTWTPRAFVTQVPGWPEVETGLESGDSGLTWAPTYGLRGGACCVTVEGTLLAVHHLKWVNTTRGEPGYLHVLVQMEAPSFALLCSSSLSFALPRSPATPPSRPPATLHPKMHTQ